MSRSSYLLTPYRGLSQWSVRSPIRPLRPVRENLLESEQLCLLRTLCLLKTSSTAQSSTFPRFGASSPVPMLHLLYALFATARSSLKPQRELECPGY